MVAPSTVIRLEETARDLFEVVTQLGFTALRGRRRSGDLKEVEFLSLAILQERGTMIVGDIQRLLGVLPAQMSRIIRSLENRPQPLITCQINPRDKRKVDVCLTPFGEKALADYQTMRTDRLVELLRDLPEREQEDLNRLVDKLHGLLERGSESWNSAVRKTEV
jgi:DNA-binding MarR family transcriptional regulator